MPVKGLGLRFHSVSYFYLWGNLKQKVYVNSPHTIEEEENEIRRVLGEITHIELQKVFQNFLQRCHHCVERDRHHFQHL
ncbi:hypothetical protein C0J52_15698 [Blattella germanica]|nr:hypothetical protein C0J52_15698 [Blattella germanica]